MPDATATAVSPANVLRFLRLPMSLVPVLAMVAGVVQGRQGWPVGIHDWLAIVAMIFLSLAIFGDNGYHDRQIDAKKSQPFATDHPALARRLALALYVIGLVLSSFDGWSVGASFAVLIMASALYSAWAVNIPGLKNLVAASVSASLFILGGLVAGHVNNLQWLSAGAVLLVICAMEIIKDVEDVAVDEGFRRTLPMLWPRRRLNILVWALLLSGCIVAWTVRVQTFWFFSSFSLGAASMVIAALTFSRHVAAQGGKLGRRWMYAGLWFGVIALTAAAWH